jgi:hypothetical protein
MELALFFGTLAAIGLGLFLLDCLFTRRRLERLEAQAHALGFSFARTAQPFAGSSIEGLCILADDSAAVINVMQGRAGGCDAIVFELARLNPACPMVAATTVAAFRCTCGRLPVLAIGDRDLAHRLDDLAVHRHDSALGDTAPFFVHCADQRRAHEFLTPARLQHLRATARHFRIESSSDWIFVYRPGVRIRPEALPEFLQGTSVIASGLLDGEPRQTVTAG